jgi:hypothetical protein
MFGPDSPALIASQCRTIEEFIGRLPTTGQQIGLIHHQSEAVANELCSRLTHPCQWAVYQKSAFRALSNLAMGITPEPEPATFVRDERD